MRKGPTTWLKEWNIHISYLNLKIHTIRENGCWNIWQEHSEYLDVKDIRKDQPDIFHLRPVTPGTFWINPLNKHFSLIKASDLVHIDLECNVLEDGNQAAVNAAGFSIHAAIHKARPDIVSACHTHLIHGKTYLTFGKELEMINQDVCIFHERHSVFSNFGGVALDEREGEEIAEALGPDGLGVILQNHGLLTVGKTVDEAAFLFNLMEDSCHAQLLADAASAGGYKKQFINDEVATYTRHMTGDARIIIC